MAATMSPSVNFTPQAYPHFYTQQATASPTLTAADPMASFDDDACSIDSEGNETHTLHAAHRSAVKHEAKIPPPRTSVQMSRRPPSQQPAPTRGRFSLERFRARPAEGRTSGSSTRSSNVLPPALRGPLKLMRPRSSYKKEASLQKRQDAPEPKHPGASASNEHEQSITTTAPSQKTAAAAATAAEGTPVDFAMVKRRVRVNLATLESPLLSAMDVVVDARYHHIRRVGAGAFSVVLSATDAHTGGRVAIKKVFAAFSSARAARAVLREVRLLRHLRHAPHIAPLLDIDVPRDYHAWDSVYLVTPLRAADLRQALRDGVIVTSSARRKRAAYGVLRALAHMHELGLVHRDVKSRNVLLDADGNATLCDLGSARFCGSRGDVEEDEQEEEEPAMSTQLTTLVQCAPEFCLGGAYGAAVDVWAAGCVIAEMEHPAHGFLFDVERRGALLHDIADVVGAGGDDAAEMAAMLPRAGQRQLRRLGKKSRLRAGHTQIAERIDPAGRGANADPVVVDLLEKMLRFSPRKRLTAKQALAHPWFDDVREKEEGVTTGSYDFRLSEPHRNASRAELKQALWEEVVAFHPEAAGLRGSTTARLRGRMSIS